VDSICVFQPTSNCNGDRGSCQGVAYFKVRLHFLAHPLIYYLLYLSLSVCVYPQSINTPGGGYTLITAKVQGVSGPRGFHLHLVPPPLRILLRICVGLTKLYFSKFGDLSAMDGSLTGNDYGTNHISHFSLSLSLLSLSLSLSLVNIGSFRSQR